MQSSDIREANEWLGMSSNNLEIQERNDLRRAIATTQALDCIDISIIEHCHQILRAALWATCNPACAFERTFSQLDAIPMRFPPRDSAQDVRIGVVRAGGTDNANSPSRGKSMCN
jgi:hypothetical protein